MSFECRETSAAETLAKLLRQSEENNRFTAEEDPAFASFDASRYDGNVHRPEFYVDRMPREIALNETLAVGSTILKVRIRNVCEAARVKNAAWDKEPNLF